MSNISQARMESSLSPKVMLALCPLAKKFEELALRPQSEKCESYESFKTTASKVGGIIGYLLIFSSERRSVSHIFCTYDKDMKAENDLGLSKDINDMEKKDSYSSKDVVLASIFYGKEDETKFVVYKREASKAQEEKSDSAPSKSNN